MSPAPKDPNTDSYAALYQLSARVSGIAFEMVIPPLFGIGLDRLFGTVVLCTLVGVLLGMTLGFSQLLKMAKDCEGIDKPPKTSDNDEV